jgi:peroxiredoxin
MKRKLRALALLAGLGWVFLLTFPAGAELQVGQRFANLKFTGASSLADRAYLGLERPGEFTLRDIKARYVLVQIFSDSCPHCMVEAPNVNRLYRLIAHNPKLKGSAGQDAVLKMLGLGFYSPQSALEKWRLKFDVPFPLIPDPKAQVCKALDIPGTPSYVVFNRLGEVVFVFAGEMASPGNLLKQILARLEF